MWFWALLSWKTAIREEKPSTVLETIFFLSQNMMQGDLLSSSTSHMLCSSISFFQLLPLFITLTELFPFYMLYKSASHHSTIYPIYDIAETYLQNSGFHLLSSRLLCSETRASRLRLYLSATNSASCYLIKLNFRVSPAPVSTIRLFHFQVNLLKDLFIHNFLICAFSSFQMIPAACALCQLASVLLWSEFGEIVLNLI